MKRDIAWEEAWEITQACVGLHESHAGAGGAGEVAGAAAGVGAAATPADHP